MAARAWPQQQHQHTLVVPWGVLGAFYGGEGALTRPRSHPSACCPVPFHVHPVGSSAVVWGMLDEALLDSAEAMLLPELKVNECFL